MAPFAAGQQPVKGPLMTHKRDRGGAGGQTAEVCVCARVHVRVRDGERERRGGGDCGFYFGLPVKSRVRVGVRALVISFIIPSRGRLMWVQAGPRAPACLIFSSSVAPLSGSSGSGFLST